MNVDQCRKWMAALEKADIKSYQFDTDLGTHLYNNNVNAVAIPNHDLEAVVAIRSTNFGGSHHNCIDNVQCVLSDYGDIHECRAGGTSEQILTLVKELGITLSDENAKIVIDIDKRNYDIKPETGNYNRFRYLTQKQYEELSDEDKSKYDFEKDAYEEKQKKYIGQNMAASITF